VKFLRYLEPLAPVLAVGAALALVRLRDMAQAARPNPVTRALPAMLLLVSATWTAAFLSVYAHENSRLAATQWIYATAPPGSIMTAEYWDDALPRSLGFGLSPATFGYGSIMLDLYRDLPPPEASDAIYAGISDADYIIQSSHRVESAIHAEPWRYPVQGRFFDQLERGALGFTPVVSVARAPTIGGLTIDDRDADESFLNYDHPRVAIYARAHPLARADYDSVMSWALQRPWYPQREPPRPSLLLDGPVGENPSVADARWSAGLTQGTLGAAIVWILLLLVLLAIGRPIAQLVFPAFPDAGWGVARTLALVIAAYPVWLGTSLELFRFRAVAVLASLAACSLGLWRLRVWFDRARDRSRSPALGRAWLHAEAVFWLVFALFLAFRLINPDGWHPIWGGEKAMELAQINAIGRSAYFPPYDPWYADGYVNYYYYGFYLVTFLLKATGMPAEVGFNLALPTMMGLLASGGFSVAAALSRGLTRSPRLAVAGGWLGAAALSVLGNLSAIRALIAANGNSFDPFIHWTWNGSRAIDNVITEFPFFSGLYADLHAHVIALPLTVAVIALCLATATSRVIPHHHATGAAAIWLPIATRLVLLALLLGSLSATNAWDVPVYVALTVTSIVTATASIATMRRRFVMCIAGSVVTVAGGWLLFLPFHRHFVALFSALALVRDPTDLLQFLSHLGGLLTFCAVGLTVLLLPRASRPASSFWPLFVIAAGVLGIALLAQDLRPPLSTAAIALVIAALAAPPLTAAWLRLASDRVAPPLVALGQRALLLVAPVVAAGSVIAGREVFALLVALGIAAAVAWFCLPRPAERFAALLAAAGFFTAAGVEIVVVADDLIQTAAYRMNTVFKFYNQVWVLLALSSAALIALMLRDARRGTALHVAPASGARAAWSRPGLALSALFLLAMLAYPVLATGPRLAQRFTPGTQPGTLNALGWMAEGTVPTLGPGGWEEIAFAGDLAAITWLNANVTGSPVIAEASIGPYRCNGSRIANATGLPTIIGWERHEQQQRYPDSLPARVADVRTLYTSSDVDEKSAILHRYNVAYVVVGDLERRYPRADNDCTSTGNDAGIAAFAEMTGTTLDVAFSSGGTTIYQVLPVVAA
jgi:YYY domain-containing protein